MSDWMSLGRPALCVFRCVEVLLLVDADVFTYHKDQTTRGHMPGAESRSRTKNNEKSGTTR